MRKVAFALFLFLFSFNLSAFCQNGNKALKSVVLKLQSFYTIHAIEKVYLQFDKPGYIAGDTIYFKAYVTFGEQHELSAQSGILYIDLIDPKNNICKSIKLQLKDGLACGDFALPDSLHKGFYRVRAYTQLMQRAEVPGSFEAMIPVGSLENYAIPDNSQVQKNQRPDIQFFPEGGGLIYGVDSKVAFKAIDARGLGLNVKGVVMDNTGKTVASFSSNHLGMGVFDLTPKQGANYKANVVFADGTQNNFDLPLPAANCILLSINNEDADKLTLGISCDDTFYNQNKNKDLGVIINSGTSVSSLIVKLIDPRLTVDLAKKRLHTGIMQFTLFSPANEPLSERLIFIQRPDQLKLEINTNNAVYHAREKVSFSLNVKNRGEDPVEGHFSVSVTDESKVPDGKNANSILSWLLLSSDLKGYIEDPSYYFENINKETQTNLDALMLTQGYRHFVWKQLLNNEYLQQTGQPEKGLEIKGMVTNLQNKPIKEGKVNLMNLEGGPMLAELTDTVGRFDFANLAFTDSTRFIIKAATVNGRNATRIQYLKDEPEPVFNEGQYPTPLNLDSIMAASLQNRKIQMDELQKYSSLDGKLLKEVRVKEINNNAVEPMRIAGKADQLIDREDIRCHGRLSDCLNGRLLGVIFKGDEFSKLPYLSAPITLMGGNPPMLIIVDGIKIPRDEGIDLINLEDVEKVEVFRNSSTSIFGVEGGGGVFYITTVRGSGKSSSKGTAVGILPITVHGFYKAREFYSPKYESNATSNRPDLRSTIYWNPEIVTDKDGKALFDYYNADGKGTYRVVIEGIDEKGNLGRQVYRYKVE